MVARSTTDGLIPGKAGVEKEFFAQRPAGIGKIVLVRKIRVGKANRDIQKWFFDNTLRDIRFLTPERQQNKRYEN
jgi:hypothetical protein